MDLKTEVLTVPIEDVISRYLPLRNRGNHFAALCPFHADTNPSLKVSPEKKMYKCFACGAGGDSIQFVMEYLKISFKDALEKIACDHDIHVPHLMTIHHRHVELDLLKDVMNLYVEERLKSEDFSKFLAGRGISRKTADAFKMGVAPDKDIVVNFMKKNDIPSEYGLELGLIRKTQDGFTDFFKNRFMFPILDEAGKCVGFSGRAISDDMIPKYMNSKESLVFNKSSLLFGLHLNKEFIKAYNSVIVVEGYMDLVALYEHSIPNAVATMGTSLSAQNILKLKNYANKIILGFDSDTAGIKARDKVNSALLEEKIVASSISYHPWKDADEFLREEPNGPVELWKRIEKSIPLIDKNILTELVDYLDSTLEEKLDYLKNIFSILSPLGLSLDATERVIKYAGLLGLRSDKEIIVKTYRDYLGEKYES